MCSNRANRTTSSSTLHRVALLGIAASAAGVMMLGGCKSSKDYYSYDSIKGNLTPELQGLTERPLDVERNVAVAENVDLRLFWGDLGRVWLTDNPSILSPYRTISTSGQPY